MGNETIKGQELIDQFLTFLPTEAVLNKTISIPSISRKGSLPVTALSEDVKNQIADLLSDTPLLVGEKFRDLYNGNTTHYNNDHSTADFVLIGYLNRNGLSPDEIDQVMRTSKLYRPKWDEKRGDSTWLHYTISKAIPLDKLPQNEFNQISTAIPTLLPQDLEGHRPLFISGGMAAREFAGPKIDTSLALYPLNAITGIAALGAVGKTSLLLSHSCHIAAGRHWNNSPLKRRKVVFLSVEESKEELDRKFSAITSDWPSEARDMAIENLLLISLLGQDKRLVTLKHGAFDSSGVAEEIIAIANGFGLKDGMIVLDHLQGFATGDLNSSESATAICREANKIVKATGAAVVFAAHVSKANILTTKIEQGIAVGSLAFENACRQLIGIITMPEEDAKKYELTKERKMYARLEVPKNSYGSNIGGIWLKKVFASQYHTSTLQPVILQVPIPGPIRTANERILELLINQIAKDPLFTKNKLDKLAGKNGVFKASKDRLRTILNIALDDGSISLHSLSLEERADLVVPKQIKEVLRVAI